MKDSAVVQAEFNAYRKLAEAEIDGLRRALGRPGGESTPPAPEFEPPVADGVVHTAPEFAGQEPQPVEPAESESAEPATRKSRKAS